MVHTCTACQIPSPVRCPEGRGVRRLDCQQYAQCLDVAAHKDWPGFSCHTCSAYLPDPLWRKKLSTGKTRRLLQEILMRVPIQDEL